MQGRAAHIQLQAVQAAEDTAPQMVLEAAALRGDWCPCHRSIWRWSANGAACKKADVDASLAHLSQQADLLQSERVR